MKQRIAKIFLDFRKLKRAFVRIKSRLTPVVCQIVFLYRAFDMPIVRVIIFFSYSNPLNHSFVIFACGLSSPETLTYISKALFSQFKASF